jgi:hypothetical protein
MFFSMASSQLAAGLLFSGCGQQGSSNKAAIQQESPKNLASFPYPFRPSRLTELIKKIFTRATGKTLENFYSGLVIQPIPMVLRERF